MKKVLGSFFVLFILLHSVILLIAQQDLFPFAPEERAVGGETNLDRLINKIKELFQDTSNSSETRTNIVTILLGFVLWMVLFSIFKSMNLFQGQSLISGIISLVFTIIAYLYLPPNIIDPIAANYAALGYTIIIVMPFAGAIYFTVWITPNVGVARAIWAVFFLFYLFTIGGLWLEIDPNANLLWEKEEFWPYLFACVSSLILFTFMSPIRRFFWEETVKGVQERINKNITLFGLGIGAGAQAAQQAASPGSPKKPGTP